MQNKTGLCIHELPSIRSVYPRMWFGFAFGFFGRYVEFFYLRRCFLKNIWFKMFSYLQHSIPDSAWLHSNLVLFSWSHRCVVLHWLQCNWIVSVPVQNIYKIKFACDFQNIWKPLVIRAKQVIFFDHIYLYLQGAISSLRYCSSKSIK